MDPTFLNWRNTYENDYFSPGEIVSRVLEDVDDVSVNFKLNFMFLFFSTMIECYSHGKCKLKLLYVDYVKCNGMTVDRTISHIKFWNLNRLQKRETLKLALVDLVNIKNMEEMLTLTENHKGCLVSKLRVMYRENPGNQEIKKLVKRFETVFNYKPEWGFNGKGEARETSNMVMETSVMR
ncbi:hypothetical protein L1987_59342 [Smallanthus sonchifolius]|uniref:Uncharacterized protein n=1 Tax=Smallanthus sonchifolius TaxID=185202 RepID=A0ACB9D4Y5_9ASTR|nr:hypothetical protein L1987_59342 [Smallanthus sonchifolius]